MLKVEGSWLSAATQMLLSLRGAQIHAMKTYRDAPRQSLRKLQASILSLKPLIIKSSNQPIIKLSAVHHF